MLEAHPDINYIVGTSPTTEAAVQLLRDRGLPTRSRSLPITSRQACIEDIKRGRVMAAPTDSAVIQGRIAIDQAVRILEGKDYLKHVGPELYVIDKTNIEHLRLSLIAGACRLQAGVHGRLAATAPSA